MRVVVAVPGERGRRLGESLTQADAEVVALVEPRDVAGGAHEALAHADLLVIAADRRTLTAELVAACDELGVRIAPLCGRDDDRRRAALFGLSAVDDETDAQDILHPSAPRVEPDARGRTIVVWGAAGAPGRTTVAIELACDLARDGRRVALVDADSHAPSLALATGLSDEGPGFAAACRRAERGALSRTELTRIASRLGAVDVLTGLNRPSRWPELSASRVGAALAACRAWADAVVVDVASPLERDEEIVSDLDGPRRNAATLAALAAADLVVAVVGCDPVGVSRFVRAYPDLRATIGTTPVRVLANKLRPGVLGIDARAQVRRALERFTGVSDVWFAPWDARAADAAILSAQPIAHAAARSSFATALRRFAGEAIASPAPARRGPAAARSA
ncbi:AAA family ATPase [Microbacterium sp. No. 7]|uniref:AAA family ATPase n=1 Tax=Microbacterium sp. No. 7 TaxID=1714373 RepID=UPI0006CF995E|nr:P-loop NTPase [Microbacterium sp. No. 7]ALJ21263.1 hypothetical protein AOA12_15685 [Microbacterium sp. No. 7]